MRYTLLLHWPEVTVEEVGKDEWEGAMAAFHAYTTALEEAGALVSAEVLQSTSASTTLFPDGGTLRVQDGPFADTKERLGGTIVIEVPDLDAALAWAEKCPSAQWGPIEIRPSAVRFSEGTWVEVT